MPSFLADALAYTRRGWSVLPIKHKSGDAKKPAVRTWKPFQEERADEATIRAWFGRRDLDGLAIICGKVSGGLAVRDFDTMAGYDAWAAAFPRLATTLPTAETARGRHVYVTAADEKFVKMPDGEFRGSSRQYVLAPPSIHDTGAVYRWVVPLGSSPPPRVSPGEVGLLGVEAGVPSTATERTEGHRELIPASVVSVASVSLSSLSQDRAAAVLATLPDGTGQRNDRVFELARVLKACPETAELEAASLRPIVQDWHRCGVRAGVIGSQSFDLTWVDFVTAWPKVRFPVGRGVLEELRERLKDAPPPPEAAIYDTPDLQAMVALCRGLHDVNPAAPFFLACRTAARFIEVDHATAARYLRVLEADGIIRLVDRGGQGHNARKASRFVYTGRTPGPK